MTYDEIIKALERCPQHTECCYCNSLEECGNKRILTTSVFDLINRLQDEKQALINGQETLQKHLTDKQRQIEKFEKIEHFATKTIDTQHAEIERLKHRKTELQIRNQELQHEKSEAIKEFAEKLKHEITSAIDTYYNSNGGGYYLAEDVIDDIDNLVKEMTGVETNQRKEDDGR